MSRSLLLTKPEHGFTLTEILVSIALIAIGVLGFSMNTIGVIQGNQISGNVTVATNLAQDKMEELKAESSFADVDNCSSPPDQDITPTASPGGIYDRCWVIRNSPLGSSLKEITVTVSWTDYMLPRNVVLATLVFTG